MMKMSVFTLHLCNISQQPFHPVLGLIWSPEVPLVQQISPKMSVFTKIGQKMHPCSCN